MSSVQFDSLFQTILGLMIAAFPVIDTDEKKQQIWKAIDPLIRLFCHADREIYYYHTLGDNTRIIENFEKFVSFIKTDTISLSLLLNRIENQYIEIKKCYDEECKISKYLSYGDDIYDVSMSEILIDIIDSRSYEKIDEDIYDCFRYSGNDIKDELDSYKVKNTLVDDHDKKAWKHKSKDVLRHERKKSQIQTKKNTTKEQQVSREPSTMKSSRFLVKDFHL